METGAVVCPDWRRCYVLRKRGFCGGVSKGGEGELFLFQGSLKNFSRKFCSEVFNQSVIGNFQARSGNFFSVKVCPEFFNQDPIIIFQAGSA